MERRPELQLTKVDSIGTLNIMASITIIMVTIALMLSFTPPEYLPVAPGVGNLIKTPWFMISLGLAILLGHIPLGIRTRQIIKEIDRINESIMTMMDSLSVSLRTGMNFTSALRRSVQKITSRILYNRMLILLSLLEEGNSMEYAVEKISFGLPERAVNILRTLIPASESGGKASKVINISSEFARRMRAFERNKKSAMLPYYYISLLAISVFEGATLFLLYLTAKFQAGGLGEEMTGFISLTLSVDYAWILVYYINLVVVLLSSLFVSKVVRGSIKFYSDYLVIFIFIHLLITGILPLRVI